MYFPFATHGIGRSVVKWQCILESVVLACAIAFFGMARAHADPVNPKLTRLPDTQYELHGVVREYMDAVTQNWLLKMPDTNPAILEMFADRDKQPHRQLLPWSGEFAGKYLTGGVQIYRLNHDPALKEYLAQFVGKLTQTQADDGYMGPFEKRLEGNWDVWGHYHIMLGLLLWHEETGDQQALGCAVKIGDLLCRKFLHTDKHIVDTGSATMNHAAIHALCLLYEITRTPSYLALARQIAEEFQDERAGDYIRGALEGKEFYQSPKPRWEALHAIQGIAELYRITGEENYRQAFEHLWWSIVKLDRHNNGGFSSGEQAQGNPYHRGAIETCCTVAWLAMSVDMLQLSGDSIVADELELSTLNQVLGYQHPSGRACTYNTPMDGVRLNSMQEIGFQIRPGSEEINCCSANAPRGFGLISEWALLGNGRGLTLNWYGPSSMTAQVNGQRVILEQKTEYPRTGEIVLHVSTEAPLHFPLQLRIPHWSGRTSVEVNGQPVSDVKAGTYLTLNREWKAGDSVRINLDMSLHYWVGEQQSAGRTSIYRGPVLLVLEGSHEEVLSTKLSPQWKRPADGMARANEPGAFLELAFEGSSITWTGKRYDDAGKAQVMIDGQPVAIVDQYGPGRDIPFSWELKGLSPGPHTFRLTILNEHHPDSKGYWLNVTKLTAPVPTLDATQMEARVLSRTGTLPLHLEVTTATGKKMRLRDYGTAGEGGISYVSWLNVQNVSPTPFSQANPLRSGRPEEKKQP